MGDYHRQLHTAMHLLAQDKRTIFMGQAVACKGTGMTASFDGIAREKLLEMPVAEDMQLGMAIGMSLSGYLPICVFPRINFLLLAMSQLVLHLDKLPLYSDYRPKVIIRTAIATPIPLDPGTQHLGDFTAAIDAMLTTVNVVRLEDAAQIVPAYKTAMEREGSSLIVEYSEFYGA